jgi:predicted RNA-binding protein with RPS1 domain
MDFLTFMERAGSPDDSGLTPAALRRSAPALQQAESLASALGDGCPEALSGLSTDGLRWLGHAHRRWRHWREAIEALPDPSPARDLAAKGTTRVDQARFLAATDDAVEDLPGLLALWDTCLLLARRDGSAKVTAGSAAKTGGGDTRGRGGAKSKADDIYTQHRGKIYGLAEMPSERWLNIRRGEREDELAIEIVLPTEALNAVSASQDETVQALYEQWIAPRLTEALIDQVSAETDESTARLAADQYMSLVRARPVRCDRLLAVYVGRARDPVGMALLDREGRLSNQIVLHPGPDFGQRVERFARDQRPDHAALPARANAQRLLTETMRRLPPRLPTARVHTAAIEQARTTLEDVPADLPRVIEAAIALGRRAQHPATEWGRLDPVSIGLTNFQSDLDQDLLREALVEARLARKSGIHSRPAPAAGAVGAAVSPSTTLAEPAKSALPGSPAALGAPPPGVGSSRRRVVVEPPRARSSRGRMNPARRAVEVVGEELTVRSIDDLRTGLVLKGTVTNTSRFGAFVSIGLQNEALIHVSELADRYISAPDEVVSVGQEVIARVISVDADRKRISLSMKDVEQPPAAEAMANAEKARAEAGPGPAGAGGAPAEGRGGGIRVPQSRTEALAQLDQLFKDKGD